MTKVFATILLLATIAGLVWTIRTDGADGSWIAAVVPAGMLLLTLGITKKRTGQWLSDSSGGH
jgi:hypothetical protein